MKAYLETWERIFGVRRAKRVYIAATKQNVGKTTVSLGLISALRNRGKNVGFIKPVGQRYLVEEGQKVDEDSVLMERIFGFNVPLEHMSPVAVDRGYTERFLDEGPENDPTAKIRESFSRVSENRDFVVVEGTGHAGVGSVFDLSNAAVAKMLGSSAVIVAPGGIGNPIDEIMLNKSLFDASGVPLAGVIINKVRPHKYDKVDTYVRKGLERLGIKVLGVIPYVDSLGIPTMKDFQEELDMDVLCGESGLGRQMSKVLVGAMDVREAFHYLENDCMVITPGNRGDLLNLLIKVHTGRFQAPRRIAGIILSGGLTPNKRVWNALKKADIPTLVSSFNTYDVAAMVHDLTVKIKSRDSNKIKMVFDIVEKHVDMDSLLGNTG
jgi:phosphate acetyltransferase